jgi:hypothetical protein
MLVRIAKAVTIALVLGLSLLSSCMFRASLRGTVRDSRGPVTHYWLGWKEGLLTRYDEDKWETAYVVRGGHGTVFPGPPQTVVVNDENGAFRLDGIPRGDATLFVSIDNKKWGAYEIRKNRRGKVVEIKMEDLVDIDKPLPDLLLECTKEGDRLYCSVKELCEGEVAEVIVLKGVTPDYRQVPVTRVTVESDGRATVDLKRLDPGEYTVTGMAVPREISVRRARTTSPLVFRVE